MNFWTNNFLLICILFYGKDFILQLNNTYIHVVGKKNLVKYVKVTVLSSPFNGCNQNSGWGWLYTKIWGIIKLLVRLKIIFLKIWLKWTDIISNYFQEGWLWSSIGKDTLLSIQSKSLSIRNGIFSLSTFLAVLLIEETWNISKRKIEGKINFF